MRDSRLQWRDVGALDDFEERRPAVVEVDGREVGILRWNGDFFAVRNICPHMLAPVCRGIALALITSDEQGAPQVDADHPVIACPWHGWEFDVATGRAVCQGLDYKVRTYPTTVEEGRVKVMAGRPQGTANG
jgi:nitrite reductase/ring-hydroxylating ferredoxin subunit